MVIGRGSRSPSRLATAPSPVDSPAPGEHPLSALVVGLGGALRREVLPELGRRAGRAHVAAGAGGDVTFAIDERAERRMEDYLGEHAPEVAFYSEDRGLIAPGGEPEWVLVVDPIDGTRPAIAGFEAACVSVAAARWAEGAPTMADVEVGSCWRSSPGPGSSRPAGRAYR